MSKLGFDKEWNNLGYNLLRKPVGFKFIHDTIDKQKVDLDCEQSGHILSKKIITEEMEF